MNLEITILVQTALINFGSDAI